MCLVYVYSLRSYRSPRHQVTAVMNSLSFDARIYWLLRVVLQAVNILPSSQTLAPPHSLHSTTKGCGGASICGRGRIVIACNTMRRSQYMRASKDKEYVQKCGDFQVMTRPSLFQNAGCLQLEMIEPLIAVRCEGSALVRSNGFTPNLWGPWAPYRHRGCRSYSAVLCASSPIRTDLGRGAILLWWKHLQ